MKKIILFFALGFAIVELKAQQDPQYNLYQFNQMTINPAYAGARDAIAVVLDARKQWVSFPGAPTTLAFSIHSPILNNKVGVGLNILSDQIGPKSITGAYGNFSYILKINNRTKLSFGLRAGYLNYHFNYSKINYQDASESISASLNNTNKSALDFDAGLFLRTNTFFTGLSVTHLNHAKIYSIDYDATNKTTGLTSTYSSNYILNSHLFFIVGKSFVFNENFIFSPSIMIKAVSATMQPNVNLNVLLKQRIWLGVYLNGKNAIGALAQLYVTDKLRIGYSFDTGIGSRKYLGSSHEIMFGFDFGKLKPNTVSPRFL